MTSGFSQSPHMVKVTEPEFPPPKYLPITGKSCNVQAVRVTESVNSRATAANLFLIVVIIVNFLMSCLYLFWRVTKVQLQSKTEVAFDGL